MLKLKNIGRSDIYIDEVINYNNVFYLINTVEKGEKLYIYGSKYENSINEVVKEPFLIITLVYDGVNANRDTLLSKLKDVLFYNYDIEVYVSFTKLED